MTAGPEQPTVYLLLHSVLCSQGTMGYGIRKRIDDSARDNGWEIPSTASVSSLVQMCELPTNCTKLYGGSITTSSWKRYLMHEGTTWKYVPIDSLEMSDPKTLLVRVEFEAKVDYNTAMGRHCGVVLTGQPEIDARGPSIISSSFKKAASMDTPSRRTWQQIELGQLSHMPPPLSTLPGFRESADQIFQRLVLAWLSSGSSTPSLHPR
ncbi:hypothetical protein EDB92DRAFT_2100139 [Lactarius akahatsu]|uniref:Uncharacterized protein n=1 Tax=Lactarius akahatsu TaxID=416441 RepID=A0AAD4LTD6_9AGAM|nr:hypothetical protein EDB92DRAFT_2100139 [Lactarius akahatsu]